MHMILETYFHFIKKILLSQKEAEVIGLDIAIRPRQCLDL